MLTAVALALGIAVLVMSQVTARPWRCLVFVTLARVGPDGVVD